MKCTNLREQAGQMKLTKDILLAYIGRQLTKTLEKEQDVIRKKMDACLKEYEKATKKAAKPYIEKAKNLPGKPDVSLRTKADWYYAEVTCWAKIDVESCKETFRIEIPKITAERLKDASWGEYYEGVTLKDDGLRIHAKYCSHSIDVEDPVLEEIKNRANALVKRYGKLRSMKQSMNKTARLALAEMIFEGPIKRNKVDEQVLEVVKKTVNDLY